MRADRIMSPDWTTCVRLLDEASRGLDPRDLSEVVSALPREFLEMLAIFGIQHYAAVARYFQEHDA